MTGAGSAPRIVLASASPRRAELMAQLGLRVFVSAADIDESYRPGEAPAEYVERMALTKAREVHTRQDGAATITVAADTAVVLGDEIFGKPASADDAARILGQLSGRTHQVLTAVAVLRGNEERVAVSRSEVRFRPLKAAEISAYWLTGEPADKAGAYAIQGVGAVFVEALNGSYSGVMGLPLYETAQLLESLHCLIMPTNQR